MSHFVLIHGASQGEWCWYKVRKLLEDRGHTVNAPDLPGHEPQSSLDFSEITPGRYVDSVTDLIATVSDPVILVGHSLGGAVITGVIDRMEPGRIRKACFVSAFIPRNGESAGELLKADKGSELQSCFSFGPGNMSVELIPDRLADIVYNGCSEEDTAYARSRVVPQSILPIDAPLRRLPGRSVRCIGVVCQRDRALTPAFQENMYRRAGCEEIRYLDSGHAPFFSRPRELADILGED